METPVKRRYTPCMWCLDTESNIIACHCTGDCEMPDCAMAERDLFYVPPVPKFGGPVSKPKVPEAVVPVDVVNLKPDEYADAINAVVDLHKSCDCRGCKSGNQRPACRCCNDFWPCITIRTLRLRIPRDLDSAEGIAYG